MFASIFLNPLRTELFYGSENALARLAKARGLTPLCWIIPEGRPLPPLMYPFLTWLLGTLIWLAPIGKAQGFGLQVFPL